MLCTSFLFFLFSNTRLLSILLLRFAGLLRRVRWYQALFFAAVRVLPVFPLELRTHALSLYGFWCLARWGLRVVFTTRNWTNVIVDHYVYELVVALLLDSLVCVSSSLFIPLDLLSLYLVGNIRLRLLKCQIRIVWSSLNDTHEPLVTGTLFQDLSLPMFSLDGLNFLVVLVCCHVR
jgi:hypothetical protein